MWMPSKWRWAANRSPFALLLLLTAGCATAVPPSLPREDRSLPANALVTQRAILTVRGRQFTLNGYLSLSETGGMRLLVTETFGNVMADLLIKRDGTVQVIRSSPMLRPAWIERYLAADLQCLFGDVPGADCPGWKRSPTHYVIQRAWYTLDLQIVAIQPGLQAPDLFEGNPKATP